MILPSNLSDCFAGEIRVWVRCQDSWLRSATWSGITRSTPMLSRRKKFKSHVTLDHDVLVIVLDYVQHTSPKSIYNVCLSSRQLYDLARKFHYRSLRFTFARCWEMRNALLLQNLLTDSAASSFVHQIYVNWASGVVPRHDGEEGKRLMDQFIKLMPQLTSLKTFM